MADRGDTLNGSVVAVLFWTVRALGFHGFIAGLGNAMPVARLVLESIFGLHGNSRHHVPILFLGLILLI